MVVQVGCENVVQIEEEVNAKAEQGNANYHEGQHKHYQQETDKEYHGHGGMDRVDMEIVDRMVVTRELFEKATVMGILE